MNNIDTNRITAILADLEDLIAKVEDPYITPIPCIANAIASTALALKSGDYTVLDDFISEIKRVYSKINKK